MWVPRPVPGAVSLECRDVHGFDPRRALALNAGERELSLPLVTGSPAGAFTVVFRDDTNGVVLGGDPGPADPR